jgi:hypothetical protein
MKSLTEIKNDILIILQDSTHATFTTEELDLLIPPGLAEISRYRPYQVRSTLTTAHGSRDLTLPEEDKPGLLWLDGPEGAPAVEYPVDLDPRSLHNFTRFGDTLTILVDEAPSAAESVYLYLAKVQTLTEEDSTLDVELEDLLANLVAARAAINKARSYIGKINIGSANTPQLMESWGQMKLAETLHKLRKIAKPAMYIEYPRGVGSQE